MECSVYMGINMFYCARVSIIFLNETELYKVCERLSVFSKKRVVIYASRIYFNYRKSHAY